MEMQGIEPWTAPILLDMLRENYTTKPHPLMSKVMLVCTMSPTKFNAARGSWPHSPYLMHCHWPTTPTLFPTAHRGRI